MTMRNIFQTYQESADFGIANDLGSVEAWEVYILAKLGHLWPFCCIPLLPNQWLINKRLCSRGLEQLWSTRGSISITYRGMNCLGDFVTTKTFPTITI